MQTTVLIVVPTSFPRSILIIVTTNTPLATKTAQDVPTIAYIDTTTTHTTGIPSILSSETLTTKPTQTST
jgi:hypothetical protein